MTKSNRKIWFRFATLFVPIILWAFIELFLRISHQYSPQPLYQNISGDGNENYYRLNPNVGERYFNVSTITLPKLFPQKFYKKRPAGGLRIICLGGSTTAGFPYDGNVPFPAQLKTLLQEKYPKRNIEVINLGLSAINSFTVWDWMPDVIELNPDYILIYMGHNEFYGAFGSASSINIGQNGKLIRLYLGLQHLHSVEAFKYFMRLFTSPPQKGPSTLMRSVIANRAIEVNSTTYRNALRNFQTNLNKIIHGFQKNHIKVILSNLVSNLKDQTPLEDINGIKRTPADRSFQNGQEFLKKGHLELAYRAFMHARQLDRMRFRAPDTLNQIIKNLSIKYHVPFIKMDSIFRSDKLLPGNYLFADHLHPNPRGYAWMAKAFFNTLLGQNNAGVSKAKPKFVTELDWRMGAIRIEYLKQHWPFTTKPFNKTIFRVAYSSAIDRIAYDYLFINNNWPYAHTQAAKIYFNSRDYNRACREYSAIENIYPEHIQNIKRFINCAQTAGFWPLAEREGKRILARIHKKGEWYYRLALAQFNLGKTGEALKSIKKAITAPELTPQQRIRSEKLLVRFLMALKQNDAAQNVLDHIKNQML